MILFDLNVLISEYTYSELYMTDKELDTVLDIAHKFRNSAKINRDVLLFEKSNNEIDIILTNKDSVKQALRVRERESVQVFRNRLIGIHYLN